MNKSPKLDIVNVTAAILSRDSQVLIAKRKATDSLPHKWEFPGGKVESGETPEQCLRRELSEEFGIDVIVGKFLGESVYHYEHVSIKLLAYRTFWERGDITPNAHEDFRWVLPDELEQYDFAPADLPFVAKLRRGEIDL
jgi:8-oxo-dGTP diphosphatase